MERSSSRADQGGFQGLDRKAMEAARLARISKKRNSEETTSQAGPIPKQARCEPPDSPSSPSSSTRPSPPARLQFPYGAIKKTWCFGFPRQDDIKIEEILQKATLKVALMSSWQLDFEWLASKLDLTRTRMILVMQSKDKDEQEQWRQQSKSWSKSLRLCFPPMNKGMGTMHSKLMLLFHPGHLRIVVPSANLVSFDWGETGTMENVVFLIDLPRLPEHDQGSTKNQTLTPFADELVRFLGAMNVDDALSDQSQRVVDALMKFDFSKTKHIAFVHTIGGTHLGCDAATSTGYPLLAASIGSLTERMDKIVQVDYAASSIGAITPDRLETFFSALQGQQVNMPTASSSRSSKISAVTNDIAALKPSAAQRSPNEPITPSESSLSRIFNIYYPTNDTIQSSKGGPRCAGTLFMTPNFDKPTSSGPFPVHSLRDSVSTRIGLISHAKMIIARGKNHASVYVGSANFSPSAWGTLSWDKKEKTPKLVANNWECGVLIKAQVDSAADNSPNQRPRHEEQALLPSSKLLDCTGAQIPVTFEIPGKPYVGPEKDIIARPWIQNPSA